MALDVEQFKAGQKMMWATGDYPSIAQTIEQAALRLVDAVAPAAGQELLDVATGSGNVAIPAAGRGAKVTGLDLTPELLEVARRRAAQSGVEVSFIEGDAEELPFVKESFDIVTSCFGVIFAPRHEQAASELARVAKAGGKVGFTAWTPEGLNGRMFKAMGKHMPPPPPEVLSPLLWGTEEHTRALFKPHGVELSFERHEVAFTADSPEAWVRYNERVLGPTIMAKNMLEPQGKWEALRADLLELYAQNNEAQDGSLRVSAEYLLGVGQVRA
ncbi:MAG TPA: methyltransferase domain-containing protein [Solirubrobacteraceae bacterium]|jgi:SAM-dependent methyltransferase|nr:methyltransferase domain-containing protein [Solirubrobacteraceae bacterium]